MTTKSRKKERKQVESLSREAYPIVRKCKKEGLFLFETKDKNGNLFWQFHDGESGKLLLNYWPRDGRWIAYDDQRGLTGNLGAFGLAVVLRNELRKGKDADDE